MGHSLSGSLLAGIVGQAVAVPTQPDGSIFIDRNPRLFPYILDYYRKKGAVNLGGLSSADVSDLIDEASISTSLTLSAPFLARVKPQ